MRPPFLLPIEGFRYLPPARAPGYGRPVRKPGGFLAIAATAATMAAMSAGAWPPAPAAAAPRGPQDVSGPAIYGFGTNQLGELGNGTTTATPSVSPVPAGGPPGTVTQLGTGLKSAGALLADGTLWTWGDNYYHQLGYGTANPWSPPHIKSPA